MTSQKIYEILLRKKNKLLIEKDFSMEDNTQILATIVKNFEFLGFTLSTEALLILRTWTKSNLIMFYKETLAILKQMIGADVEYHPMYPNFPYEVMNKSDSELYLNAIVHYISGGVLYPYSIEQTKFPLIQFDKLTVLNVGEEDEVHELFMNLMRSKTSISEKDKEDLSIYFSEYTIDAQVPSEIPYKEIMAFTTKCIIDNCPNAKNIMSHYVHTATDVLRIITAYSDGDISLSSDTHYKSLPRRYRKIFLSLLNDLNDEQRIADMKKYKNKWIRVGEILHPMEYKEIYTAVAYNFQQLRHNTKIRTFNTILEENLKYGNITECVNMLLTRPTEFARRLSFLLRNSLNPMWIIDEFATVINKVPFAILLKLYEYFCHYDVNNPRIFIAKGQTSKIYVKENDKNNISDTVLNYLVNTVLIEALLNQSKLLKNVYIDGDFHSYKIPIGQRSANSATKTYTRGSYFSLKEDTAIIRPFIWWTNTKDNTVIDIDLSATIYDEDWNSIDECAYYKLKSCGNSCVHSGDITNGGPYDGQGVSEFIDVNLDEVVSNGGRYISLTGHNFRNTAWGEFHCKFGWMERSNDTGEIFEPSTVKQKSDIISKASTYLTIVIDCKERKIYWGDLSVLNKNISFNNNKTFELMDILSYSLVHSTTTSLFDEIFYRTKNFVNDSNKAEYIFTEEPEKFQNLITERKEKKQALEKEAQENEYKNIEEVIIPKIITPTDIDFFMNLL